MSIEPGTPKYGKVAGNRRRILVVGKGGLFAGSIISHSVQLAGRLEYDLLALSVDTGLEGRSFEKRAGEAAKNLKSIASSEGIHCDHLVRAGDLGTVVEDIIHEIKRIELVAVDSEEIEEKIKDISVPVVRVISCSINSNGGNAMPAETGKWNGRPLGKTVVYGLLSAGCYAAVFTHTDTVMQYFTKGGWYAALPVATVFVFSFAHGAFAHNLWSLLGIEAFKKDRVRQTERKVLEKRKQLRKRPRLYAYVNPFHRIDRG